MNLALWIVVGLLVVVFAVAGSVKLVKTRGQLRPHMAWVDHFTDAQVKFVGAVEVAGALGLLLPAITGIAPVLVPIAAVGLVLMMVGAVVTHLLMREPLAASLPAVILAVLAAFVAWGRFGPYPL